MKKINDKFYVVRLVFTWYVIEDEATGTRVASTSSKEAAENIADKLNRENFNKKMKDYIND